MSAVTSARPRPLHFAAFVMNTTGHIIQGTWRKRPCWIARERMSAVSRVTAARFGDWMKTASALFGRGGRLPERHPAARYRGAFAPQPA